MEVDGGVAGAAAAAGQERRRRRGGAGCGGDDDDEETSHGSSGVELSLRLRTGAADDDDGATSAPRALLPAVEPRRNMTIFYNGRVCAVDVTEVQARAIISLASEETLAADHRRQLMRGDGGDGGRHQDGDSSSSSTSGLVRVRPAVAAMAAPSPLLAAGGVIGSPRQVGGFAGGAVAAPVAEIDPATAATGGLSMKRSLQLFLQKRKARTAAPPYAGGGRQAQAVRR